MRTVPPNIDNRLAAEYAEGVVEAVWRCMEDLLSRATQNAPVDEGPLRASGTVAVYVGDARCESKSAAIALAKAAARQGRTVDIEGEVAFNQPYAARQHETLTYRHPKSGQAKYLETPMLTQAQRYGQIIQASATLALRRAVQ